MNQSLVLHSFGYEPRAEIVLPGGQAAGTEMAWVVTRDAEQLRVWWVDCREDWLKTIRSRSRSQKGNTEAIYRRVWNNLDCFLDACEPQAHFWDVHPGYVHEFVQSMVDDELSPATINQAIAAMSSFYTHAARFYYIPGTVPPRTLWDARLANPFQGVKRFKLDSGARRPFPTTQEALRLIEEIKLTSAQGWRDMALIYGVFYTTRRSDEWLPLKWGDIKPGNDNLLFEYVCKGGKHKKQVMPQRVYDIIVRYLNEAGRWPLADDAYIFVDLSQHITRMRKSAQVTMPADGRVVRWLAQMDQDLEIGDDVVEICLKNEGDLPMPDGTGRRIANTMVLRSPMAGQLRAILAERDTHVEAGTALGKIIGAPVVGADYVPGAKPLTNHTFNALLKKYGRRAMIEDAKLHVHGLRHAGARYRYIVENATVSEMKEILGHENEQITWTYISKTLIEPEDRLADVIFEKTAPKQLKMRLKA